MFFRFFVSLGLLICFASPALMQAQSTSKKPHKRTTTHKRKKTSSRNRVTPAHRQKLRRAFVASSDLRPMAKQLLEQPSPAAYAGVERYAVKHRSDEGGMLAHLVLGYAHLQAKEYPQAQKELKLAAARNGELSDYADFFLAQCAAGTNEEQQVAALLKGFAEKHPDSLFIRQADLMRADSLLANKQNDEAIRLLESMRDSKPDVELALGRAYAATGQTAKAVSIWNHLYAEMPLSSEASAAQLELVKVSTQGLVSTPTLEQRRTRAELLMKGRRFDQAADEYRAILDSIRNDMSQQSLQQELTVKLGGALYGQHKIDEAKALLNSVSASNEDYEAQRLYYLHEIARSKDDGDTERQIISQMMQKFPASPYLQEALLSASNMYLLRPDYKTAIEFYSSQYKLFPKGRYSPYSHWKAAWLNLRLGNKDEAKRLLDEQVAMYPAGQEIPATLYWRARLAEEDGDFNRAGDYYTFIQRRFPHYYYADLAAERLRFRFDESKHDAMLDKIPEQPDVAKDEFDAPSDDLRVARAQLLTNAALFDFAVQELRSESDKLYAQAEIARVYLKADRPDRALQSLKRAVPGYFAGEIDDMPQWAWNILFPKPYWNDLKRYSNANGLDPYLVASLIRQESEFNAQAVSRANAWGLMQLLPPVGKQLAKEVRMRHFNQDQLTDPAVNLQLGTRYFKHMVDSFGGQVEYALAAYNAGADRVKAWQAQGPYRDIHEFVESIPFSETREYVQAIMRNATVYRLLYSDGVQTARAKSASAGGSD
ncbi:MAG TPA: transglycosylase SLT domain-containing protein [Terriglobales bacterium]|nr:transglycosylase SLT domain-containing protein [Terriglobales bacterium]